MLYVATFIILLIMIAIIVIEVQSKKAGIIPAPTWQKTRSHMLSLLPINPDGEILELGCGWGSTLLALSKKYPKHTIVGYEITTLPFIISKLRIWLSNRKNILIYQSDFMDTSFENAGAVFCYLSHKHMERLETKFFNELKDSAVVVSHSFPLPNVPPATTEIIKEGFWYSTIYLYGQPKD